MNTTTKAGSWVKVYRDWFACPQHANIGAPALLLGLALLSLVERVDDEGIGWAVDAQDRPWPPVTIQQLTQIRSDRYQQATRALLSASTCITRADGALGFPKYRKWQEGPTARRMRRARAKVKERNSDEYVTGEVEAEAEAEADTRGDKSLDFSEIAAVKRGIVAARVALGLPSRYRDPTAADRANIRRPVKAGRTWADWDTVIHRAMKAHRGDRAKAKAYLTLSTLSRLGNFDRYLEWDHLGEAEAEPTEAEIIESDGMRFRMVNGVKTEIA